VANYKDTDASKLRGLGAGSPGEDEETAPSDDSSLGIPPDEPEAEEPDEGEGVQASRVEVPGLIIDEYSGKTWAVPTGAFDDNMQMHSSPYDIPKDPNFHYEAHTLDQAPDMESQGFVKVTRREVGKELYRMPGELSSPLDTYYVISGNQVMMKIPKVYADRRYASLKKVCDFAVQATQPPEKTDTGSNKRIREDKLSELDIQQETTRDIKEALER
jgi:hypothetical protein